jgi:hypothetical protein
MENKEAIKKLTDYFSLQQPEEICYLLANMLIDLNQLLHMEFFSVEERKSLNVRVNKNIDQMNRFLKSGGKGEIHLLDIHDL